MKSSLTIAELAAVFDTPEAEIETALAEGGYTHLFGFVGPAAVDWLTVHFAARRETAEPVAAQAKLVPPPGEWMMNHHE